MSGGAAAVVVSQPSVRSRAAVAPGLRAAPIPVALLATTLMIPTAFAVFVGTLRISPYRAVLIALFIPMLVRVIVRADIRLGIVDLFMALHGVMMLVSLSVVQGPEVALESGGVLVLEFLGAYLIGRACVRSMSQFTASVGVLAVLVTLLVPLAVYESVTGHHLIRQVASSMTGSPFYGGVDPRYGFHRAFGPMDHPILWGVVCASLLGMVTRFPMRFAGFGRSTLAIAVVIGAITSVSSGTVATLMTQFMLLAWARVTNGIKARWWILSAGILGVYIAVDMISNRSGIKVFIHYLTFSAHTAYNRLIIWDYGFYQNVLVHPWFGIGFNVWTRPTWMHSTSMDNFWLVVMVRFGLPAFFLLAGAVLSALFLSRRAGSLSLGWVISMIGMIVAACTVHFWAHTFVWFGLVLGMGGVFFDPAQEIIRSRVKAVRIPAARPQSNLGSLNDKR